MSGFVWIKCCFFGLGEWTMLFLRFLRKTYPESETEKIGCRFGRWSVYCGMQDLSSGYIYHIHLNENLPYLKLTWHSPWKWMVARLHFLLGSPIFRGYVSFREGTIIRIDVFLGSVNIRILRPKRIRTMGLSSPRLLLGVIINVTPAAIYKALY